MKILAFLVLMILCFNQNIFSQANYLPKSNGYIQTRIASNFDKSSEFTIRRAKLWIYGELPKADYFSYKIQLNYRSFKDDALMLQDAFADVRLKSFGKIRAGRFVPDFMLQRIQPDFEIPVLERALVINSLIHNEKQMARYTGISYIFQKDTLPLHLSFGIFNENVDKPTHSSNNNFLYTSRFGYKIINRQNLWLNIGFSTAYRKLDNSTLTTIYRPYRLISGNDFRWRAELQFYFSNFELQGEFIEAKINNDKIAGYYALADYVFYKKYTEQNTLTNDNAWYGFGFNYQITGKTKIMNDFKVQKSDNSYNYLVNIQLQIFFNQI